jgi:hypothetical protein
MMHALEIKTISVGRQSQLGVEDAPVSVGFKGDSIGPPDESESAVLSVIGKIEGQLR